jgi:hypothetical protein
VSRHSGSIAIGLWVLALAIHLFFVAGSDNLITMPMMAVFAVFAGFALSTLIR